MPLLPFPSHWHQLPNGHRLHYLDEGSGQPVVMLHGNPTWCYMYRDLVAVLAGHGFRAIAPDHLGCGLSDKPQDYNYCLQAHLDHLTDLLDHLQLPAFDLVVHDWGGPVGLAYAVGHPERVRRIVLMNTIAWPSRQFPKTIYLTKCPWLGAFLVRACNLLLHVALHRVPARPLPPDVIAAYRAPYASYRDRIAIQRFPQDIPLGPRHQSYIQFQQLAAALHTLQNHPVLAAWGQRDFCFPLSFLDRWSQILPNLQKHVFPEASHFLLEDAPDQVIPAILQFLAKP